MLKMGHPKKKGINQLKIFSTIQHYSCSVFKSILRELKSVLADKMGLQWDIGTGTNQFMKTRYSKRERREFKLQFSFFQPKGKEFVNFGNTLSLCGM